MKTVLEEVIEDLKGYRTFDDKIDVRFACVLIESYLTKEEIQIKKVFTDGEQNVWDRHRDEHHFEFENPGDYFEKTFKKQLELDGKDKS